MNRLVHLSFSIVRIHLCSLLQGGSQGGDPAGVALKGAAKNELLGHVVLRDCVNSIVDRI